MYQRSRLKCMLVWDINLLTVIVNEEICQDFVIFLQLNFEKGSHFYLNFCVKSHTHSHTNQWPRVFSKRHVFQASYQKFLKTAGKDNFYYNNLHPCLRFSWNCKFIIVWITGQSVSLLFCHKKMEAQNVRE